MDATTWTAQLSALHKAGGGALTLDIVMHADRVELARRAAAGDQRAVRLLQTVLDMDDAVAARARRAPIACSACPALLHARPWAAVIVASDRLDDPAQALSLAICATCGPTNSDVQRHAMPVLRHVFPGARAVLPGNAGRA